MKLSQEEIKFIDTYLKNSGIIFLDIRYEMIDHIAASVEEEMDKTQDIFRFAFKRYMLQHKKEFLKTNRKYITIAGQKAGRLLAKSLVKPVFIVLFVLIYVSFYSVVKLFPAFDYRMTYLILNFTLVVPLAVISLYRTFSKGIKFSVADKMLGMYCVLNYFPNIVMRIPEKIHSEPGLFLYYALTLGFAAVTYFTYRELIKTYKTQFDLL